MFLILLIGQALALPSPLIGPDGPMWLGPVPPTLHDGGISSTRSAVVVDPVTGRLQLESQDTASLIRQWDGRRWTVNGGSIDESWPPRDSITYELEQGELVAATAQSGVRERYFYNEAGYLVGIHWPDGSQVRVVYGPRGKVEEIVGPGPERIRFEWGETLRVQDLLGRELELRSISAGSLGDRAWELEDDLGRTARTWVSNLEDGSERVVAWQDPRGFTTRLDWNEEGVEITGAGGALWRLGLEEQGRIHSLQLPGGESWTWTYDSRSRLSSLTEPGGRVTRWERGSTGEVERTIHAGRPIRFVRDAQGRVINIVGPGGGETRLGRDSRGRITRIEDPVGSTIRISRYSTGQPLDVVGRAGGRWSFSLDLLGRVDRVVDPTDRIVEISRTSAGDVERILDRRHGTVMLRRSVSGELTQIEDAAGHTTGLVRDASGAIQQVIRGDGSQVLLSRDSVGNLSSIEVGDERVEIERDLAGRPVQVGDTSWKWSSSGFLQAVNSGSLSLKFGRSPAGDLTRVTAGNWRLNITRDEVGDPVKWSGTDGLIEVNRDPAGRVVKETVSGQKLTLTRDPRGKVIRATSSKGEWRWNRDSSGRLLSASGPGGLSAGFDRDMAGRVTLLRYPGGALVRRSYVDSAIHDELLGQDGQVLMQRSSARNLSGNMAWMQEGDGERHLWRYDPLGQLVTIEMGGAAWSWSLDSIQGPNRELVILDVEGQASEAFPPEGPPAWGVSQRVLAVFRDGDGRMVKLRGDIGDASLRYDPVGRLQSVHLADGYWRVRYDARGRVHRLISPAGKTRRVLWSPEYSERVGQDLPLATGGDLNRHWIAGPMGMAAMSKQGQLNGVVNLGDGRPLWLLGAEGQPLALQTSPMGFPDSAPLGVLGPFGSLQLFAGGPLLRNGQALDPLSGHPIAGLHRWPWEAREVVYSRANEWMDPTGWMPLDPWSDPVALLMELGLANLGAPEGWTEREPSDVALTWLPRSMDSSRPPIGPLPTDLPLSEDPITTAFLLSALPGAQPLEPEDPLEVILQDVLEPENLPPRLELRILGFPLKEGPAWLAPGMGTK